MQEQEASVLHLMSYNDVQTQQLGMRLGELLRGGELLLLEGQLGMGKTTFTQGLARGMGITDTINSPTFTLLKEYAGRLLPPSSESSASLDIQPSTQRGSGEQARRRDLRRTHRIQRTQGPRLYHFDLYRLADPEEMFALGFEDYFSDPSGVCVVEWADRAEGLWPSERLEIRLDALPESEMERDITFTARGPAGSRYHELLQQFQKSAYATTGS